MPLHALHALDALNGTLRVPARAIGSVGPCEQFQQPSCPQQPSWNAQIARSRAINWSRLLRDFMPISALAAPPLRVPRETTQSARKAAACWSASPRGLIAIQSSQPLRQISRTESLPACIASILPSTFHVERSERPLPAFHVEQLRAPAKPRPAGPLPILSAYPSPSADVRSPRERLAAESPAQRALVRAGARRRPQQRHQRQ